ncbi:hypothetical protein IGI04_010337 [Brassica rapa subsp. trilocularis]|uniref:Senescence domain-containing protein n=1 Tax=Brassica rapa subsp. trilocularis TaxID=1813537 RepID=A0ABQ7N0Y3_BRACM|nr:hypothetical protein IGI04_010337 [Brassica rapa subsp. trilocularis]
MINYGLTIASKGQENVLHGLDHVLRDYCCFVGQRMSEKAKGEEGEEVLGNSMAAATFPEELKGERKDIVEGQCAAYWTTLAPNIEDYSSKTAKMIASWSGQLIRGILWCGDVTVERLKRGNEVMKNRLSRAEKEKDVSPETLRRIKRVKRVTQMTEKVATGVLSGVVKVSGLITSSVANSKAGKKFFGLLPGEIILASLDGFRNRSQAWNANQHVSICSSSWYCQGLQHCIHSWELIEKDDGFARVFPGYNLLLKPHHMFIRKGFVILIQASYLLIPEHKYEIVNKLQERKHIVGMTGDGVNDAPALKKADIGIAVADATDAARGASDIVLTAPGLSVIISAVLTSRAIFQRMKNYTIYAVSITIRIVFGFMLIALIWEFDFSAFMVLIIAILNDGTIMTISKDRVKPSPTPDSWKLKEIFATGIVLGGYQAVMSVVFFWSIHKTDLFSVSFISSFFSDKFGVRYIRDNNDELIGAVYLQVSIISQAPSLSRGQRAGRCDCTLQCTLTGRLLRYRLGMGWCDLGLQHCYILPTRPFEVCHSLHLEWKGLDQLLRQQVAKLKGLDIDTAGHHYTV